MKTNLCIVIFITYSSPIMFGASIVLQKTLSSLYSTYILFHNDTILSKSVSILRRICQEAGEGDLQNALRISIQLSSLVNKESRSSEAHPSIIATFAFF